MAKTLSGAKLISHSSQPCQRPLDPSQALRLPEDRQPVGEAETRALA